MSALSTSNIPFEEFSPINSIIQSHLGLYGDALRAVLVFGDLVATGESTDINLVEVIENWQGPRRVAFGSTAEMPLRGRLTLYFLLPHEFENWTADLLPGESFSAETLLERAAPAYSVLLERPHTYAFDAMRFRLAGGTQQEGPLSFFAREAREARR